MGRPPARSPVRKCYTFYTIAKVNGQQSDEALIGNHTTPNDRDVDSCGVVTALDHGLVEAVIARGEVSGYITPRPCDVDDRCGLGAGDLGATRLRVLNP